MSRAILLTCEGEFGRIAANYLAPRFPGLVTVVDAPLSRLGLLRGRARRQGVTAAAGQAAFMVFQRLQRLYSDRRIEAIKREFRLDDGAIGTEAVRMDVNSEACRAFLGEQRPSVVLVMGTRLIEEATLSGANAPFVNYHAGITPKYRGEHGAYWARAAGDAANCGVTFHRVDSGIDTGAILYQARIVPELRDNFFTYPYLQLAAGLPLLARAGRGRAGGQACSDRSRFALQTLVASHALGLSRRRVWTRRLVGLPLEGKLAKSRAFHP